MEGGEGGEGERGGREGREGGRRGGRDGREVGEGGREGGMAVIHILIGVFNSNPMAIFFIIMIGYDLMCTYYFLVRY